MGAVSRTPTRERLLLTAERLFAVHGIDAVSLRRISVAASQRNNSAAQYHFGSKEELIRAIFGFRLAAVNGRREDLVRALVRAGLDRDPRALAEAMVRPLAEQIDVGGSFYLRFLARVHQHPGASAYALPAMGLEGSSPEFAHLIDLALGHLPSAVRRNRLRLGGSLAVHATADREQRVHEGQAHDVLPPTAFVEDLVDAVAGILAAPVSPRLLTALDPTAAQPATPHPAGPATLDRPAGARP